MNGESGAFSRGLSRVRAGFDAFVGRPAPIQLAGVASVVLVLGALLPWADYGGELGDGQYSLGVESVAGGLTLLIGVVAILLLARQVASDAQAEPGYLGALGLLASLLVGAELIHSWDSGFDEPAFGIYVSGAAAGVLLLTGIALYGGAGQGDRPPD